MGKLTNAGAILNMLHKLSEDMADLVRTMNSIYWRVRCVEKAVEAKKDDDSFWSAPTATVPPEWEE